MLFFQAHNVSHRAYPVITVRGLNLHIPKQTEPQQKAHIDIKGLGPTILSRTATGPSKGTYVAKLERKHKVVSELFNRCVARGI